MQDLTLMGKYLGKSEEDVYPFYVDASCVGSLQEEFLSLLHVDPNLNSHLRSQSEPTQCLDARLTRGSLAQILSYIDASCYCYANKGYRTK